MNNTFNQDWRSQFFQQARKAEAEEYKESLHRYQLQKKWEQERKQKEEESKKKRLQQARLEEQEQIKIAKQNQQQNIQQDEIKQPELKQPELQQPKQDGEDVKNQIQLAKQKQKVPVGETIGAKVGDILKPKFAQSRKERDRNFQARIQAEANSIYDPQIEQLEHERNVAKAQYDQQMRANLRRFQSAHYQDTNGTSNAILSKLQNIESKIKDVRKKKDRYISLMGQMTDSRQLFSGQLSEIIGTSDAFLDMQTAVNKAVQQAKADKENDTFLNRWFGTINENYKNSAKKLIVQKEKEHALGEKFQNLISYLETIGYLPKSIEDFPKIYQDTAQKAFTKNGKLLLEDQDFRDNFNMNNIAEEDQFSKLSSVAKQTSEKNITFDRESLQRKKEQLSIMKDYNDMLINEGRMESVRGGYQYIYPEELAQKQLAYNTAESLLRKAENYRNINEEIAANEKSFFAPIKTGFTAFKEFLGTDWRNTYLFDTENLRNAGALVDLGKKVERGEKLNQSERILLDAKNLEDAYRTEYGQYEQENNAYKWSKISAESLKFMLEFIATSGTSAYLQGTAKVATKAASKALTKVALRNVEKYGSNVATNMLLQGAKKVAPNVIGASSRLAADAAYAAFLTNTLGAPKTLLDAAEASTPGILSTQDVFGNSQVQSVKNKQDFGQALWDSERRNWIENFSEMMGEWGMGKGLQTIGKKIPKLGTFLTEIENGFQKSLERDIQKTALTYMRRGAIETNGLLSNSPLRRIIPAMSSVFNKRTLKAGQFHGMFGEISEEYYGLMLQHMMGVQDDPNKGLWDDVKDQSKDIWGGIAVSTGILGAFGMMSSIRSQVKFDNATRNLTDAFGEKSATEIRKALAFANPFQIMNTLDRLQKEFGKGDIRGKWQTVKDLFSENNVDRKTALAEYANALLELRGAIYGQDVVERLVGSENRRLQLDAKEQGYTQASYANLKTMDPVIETLKNDASEQSFDVDLPDGTVKESTAVDFYEESGRDIVETIKAIEEYRIDGDEKQNANVDNQIAKIIAYHNALQYREGINLRLEDLIQHRIDNARQQVARMAHTGTRELVRMFKPETKEDGTPILEDEKDPLSRQKEKSLFLVRGNLINSSGLMEGGDPGAAGIKTIAGSDEIDTAPGAYGKDSGKLLVADAGGHLKYIDRSELEGWRIDSQHYDVDAVQNERAQDIYNKEQKYLDQVYSKLGATPIMGQQIRIGDKYLTILDTYHGITYSISDENGENSQVYLADNVKDLQAVIKAQEAKATQDITKWFSNNGQSITHIMRTRQKVRQQLLQEESDRIQSQSADWAGDVDSDVRQDQRSTEQPNEDLQRLWEQRDFDDTIDTEKIMHDKEAAEAGRKEQEQQQISDALHRLWEDRDFDDTIDTESYEEPYDADYEEGDAMSDEQIQAAKEREYKKHYEEEYKEDPNTPTVTTVPQNPQVPQTPPAKNAQEESLNKLVKIIEDAHNQKYEQATGFHYFIQTAEGLELFRRVHSVKPDQWENVSKNKAAKERADKYRQRLQDAYDNNGKTADAVKTEMDKILSEIENEIPVKSGKNKDRWEYYKELIIRELKFSLGWNESSGTSLYIKYIEDHNDPLAVSEALDGLSAILSKNPPNPSVISGNIYDTISRLVLDYRNTGRIDYHDPRLTMYFYGKQVYLSDLQLWPKNNKPREEWEQVPFITEEAFNALQDRLLQIKDYYENTLNWKLCTDPFTLRGTLYVDGKPIKVAGETDCVAVDRFGKRHIVDFKTYGSHSHTYHGDIDQYFKHLPVGGEEAVDTFSTGVDHAMQMYLYKMLAVQMGAPMESSETLLYGIQVENDGKLIVAINGKNVEKSSILIPDEDSGELVPNRKNLDGFGTEMQHEVYNKFRERVKQFTRDELDKVRSALGSKTIEIDSTDDSALSEDFKKIIHDANEKLNELLSRPVPTDTDARTALIDEIKDHIRHMDDINTELENAVQDYKYKLEQEGVAKRFFEDFYFVESAEDIRTLVLNHWNEEYILEYANIDGLSLDEIDGDVLQQYFDALLRMQIILNYAVSVGAVSEKNRQIIQSHVDFQKKHILLPKNLVSQFETLVEQGAFPAEESELTDVPVKMDSLEITGLDDIAGNNPIVKSKGSSGTKLADIVENSDFVTSAEFYAVRIGGTKEKPKFGVVVKYQTGKGVETFDPVEINIGHTQAGEYTAEAKKFYNQLCERTEGHTNDAPVLVKLKNSSISRTFGRIINDVDDQEKPVYHTVTSDEMQRLVGKSLEDIEYGGESEDFGLTKTQKIGNRVYVVVAAPDSKNGKKKTLYVYSGQNRQTKPISGGVVLMLKPPYDEFVDRDLKIAQTHVPINLVGQNFDQGSAWLVADILSGKYCDLKDGDTVLDILGKKFKQDGKTYPFTNQTVLQLFISWGNHNRKGKKQHIHLSSDSAGKIHISGIFSGLSQVDDDGQLGTYDKSWDLKTEAEDFVKFLQQNVRMQVFDDFMSDSFKNSDIGQDADMWFENNEDENEITFGNSPIKITYDDLQSGINGIGWYIKNGFLKTSLNHLERPLVSIDEKDPFDDQPTNLNSAATSVVGSNLAESPEQCDEWEKKMREQRQASGIDDYFNSQDNTYWSSIQPFGDPAFFIEEYEARRHIQEIVGDVDIKFQDEVLDVVQNGLVVAACYQNFIKMSRKSARGTEYHEAFHRVLELLVSEKVRDRAYKSYRRKFGKNLTDLEIAEIAADEFWWFKENKPIKKWSWNFRELLSIIKQWYNFFTKIGSFNLYRLYNSAANGKYRNNDPTPEAIERWKKLTKKNGGFLASTYTLNGTEYQHIMNRREYDAVVQTIKAVAMNDGTYKGTGVTLSAATIGDIRLTPKMIIKSPMFSAIMCDPNISRESKDKLLDVLGCVRTITNGKADYKWIDDRAQYVLNTIIRDFKKYEQQAFTEEKALQKKERRGEKESEKQEEFLTADGVDGETDEDDFTQERQYGEYEKISAEYDPITRASQRVKFFFAVQEDREYITVMDNGQMRRVSRIKKNVAGLPQMMDFKQAWALIVNRTYFCRSQMQLYERLQQLSTEDAFYQKLLIRYENLLKAAYGNENGEFMDKQTGEFLPVKNQNAAGTLWEITSVMCHAKNIPQVIESVQNSKTDERQIRIISASMEYTVRETRKNWTAAIASGEGKYIGKDSNGKYFIKRGHSEEEIRDISFWFRRFTNLLSSSALYPVSGTITIHPKYHKIENGIVKEEVVDTKEVSGDEIKSNDVYLHALCAEFVEKLNDLGIGFTIDDFMFLLNNQYGHVDQKENTLLKRLQRFVNDNAGYINDTFFKHIQDLANITDINYKKNIEQVWSNYKNGGYYSAFIDVLSRARYYRICNENMLSYLTIGGKKQYAMSEHNFITDRADEMKDPNSKKIQDLSGDAYYLYTDSRGKLRGSRVFEYLNDDSTKLDRQFIEFQPAPGMKTDTAGSSGIEYLDFSEQEDVASKYGMLAANGLILMTMADKTTYGCLYFPDSFRAFGIDWTLSFDINKEGKNIEALRNFLGSDNYSVGEQIIKGKKEVFLNFNDKILNQFIRYAECEYRSARYQLKRAKRLSDKDKVLNYYGGKHEVYLNGKKVETSVIQGARLSTFTGVFNDDGNWISFNHLKTKDADGKERLTTEEELLEIARVNFFGLKPEQKLQKMRKILSHQVQKELDYLQSLGMIEHSDDYGYKNKSLDAFKIRRMRYLLSGDEEIGEYATEGIEHSNAVVAYVADMVSKAQMSHQECFRIFAGNLACYKWEYDQQTGSLKDTTKDFFKRTGGLVSTGSHNVTDVPGLPKKVRCAEIVNEKLVSPFAKEFKDAAEDQTFRETLRNLYYENEHISIDNLDKNSKNNKSERIREIEDLANKLSGDELKNAVREKIKQNYVDEQKGDGMYSVEQLTEQAEKEANNIVSSIQNVIERQYKALTKVDVNDGATYITDECCEMLLKAIGKWNEEISNAFKILRGFSVKVKDKKTDELVDRKFTNQEMLDIAQAYRMVYTSVIGTQKYTAYGQRMEDKHTAITYFDKTAYFPIFECMATGHMRAVLNKMKSENVQILKTTSAIKEGGKGATHMGVYSKDGIDTFKEWDENPDAYDAYKLNPYEQDFDELRKQFNTDPKGKEYMPLGSQYQKVALSLLQANTKININGEELDAYQIREQVMECYLKIMEAGLDKHKNKFYKNGELDVDAFVSILKQQLSDKDASDPILDALSIEEYEIVNPNTKKKEKKRRFKVPVAALSSGKWIESIVASVINKDIVDVTSPGSAFYQRSAWASEGTMSGKLAAKISSEDDWQYVINHGAPLQEKNEQGSMDVVLSIDYFDYLFKDQPSLIGQSFNRKKEWLIKNGIISGFVKNPEDFPQDELVEIDGKFWHNAKTNIVGYRIPTQAPSSIHAMRCVDVIPVVRDTVILPKEVTAVTGSDFDIDKFFLSTKYYQEIIESNDQKQIDAIVQEFGFKDEKAMLDTFNEAKRKKEKALENNDEQALKEAEADLEKVKTAQNVKITKDGSLNGKRYSEVKRKAQHLTDKYDNQSEKKKYYLNKLIDIQTALLQTTDNNMSKLHGSIDVDTVPLVSIANELSEAEPNEDIEAFDASSLRVNVQAKMSFAIGKAGIGPYALNNNNHVFTMLYDIHFVKGKHKILDQLGLRSLSKSTDRHGHSILSWISGLINAHVDVAKDPYIRKLGVNQYTYNLVSLLIRTGYGAETFWFTSQPIMKQLYSVYDQAAGVYNQDETRSKYSRTDDEVNKFFAQYAERIITKYKEENNRKLEVSFNGEEKCIQSIEKYIKDKYSFVSNLDTVITTIMKYDQGVQVMRQISKSKNEDRKASYDVGLSGNIDYDDIELVLLAANFKLQKAAQDLSKLVQYTKIDTKKQGKTVIEQKAYLDTFHELTDPKKSPFENEGIRNMINHSFIGPKTEQAIEAMRKLLSSQIIEATPGFERIVTEIKKALNTTRTDERFMTSIAKMIVGKLKADYFFRGDDCYCVKRGINPISLIRGNNSIYALLTKIKTGVANAEDHRYDSIRDKKTGQCNNYLINSLITHIFVTRDEIEKNEVDSADRALNNIAEDDWLGAQFIKSQNLTEDAIKSSDMQNAWLDLLNDSSNTELQEFAEKLIVYAFMTSCSSGGSFDLFKFVPPAWMSGECSRLDQTLDKNDTFAAYIVQLLENLNSIDSYPLFSKQEIDEMILNFSYDDNIVKTQSADRIDSFVTVSGTQKDTPLLFGAVYGIDSKNPVSAYGDEYPAFIKVPARNKNVRSGQRKYDVYKCVAIGKTSGGTNETSVQYPIYALVQPSGGVYREGQRIYALDLQKVANEKADYRMYWKSELRELMNAIPDSKLFKDPADLFMELLGMQNSQDESVKQILDSLQPLFDENGDKFEYQTISMLMQDAERNRSAKHAEFFPMYTERQLDYFKRRSNANREAVDFNKSATDLHIEEFNDRYKPLSLSNADDRKLITEAFGDDIIAKTQSSVLHIEFYKKKFTEENGKEYFDVAITISVKNAKVKGWFEVLADINTSKSPVTYTGEFSLHLKTYSPKMGKDTKNAQVPLNDANKNAMMKELLYFLPEGAIISTHGELSDGGIHMLNTLEKYVFSNKTGEKSAYIAKVGERDAKSKKDGSDIKIPVFRKSESYKPLYVGNNASIDLEDYQKEAIPTFNVSKAKTDVSLTNDVKNFIRDQFAEKSKGKEAYYPNALIIAEIVSENKNVQEALKNSGNSRIEIFNSSELNNALTAERTSLQLQGAAQNTKQSCHTF